MWKNFRWVVFFLFLVSVRCHEDYEESLWIRRLPSDHIHVRMEFVISRDHSTSVDHTAFFPRTLSEILTTHNVAELQLSLTQGHWRLETWGDPFPSQTAPTG